MHFAATVSITFTMQQKFFGGCVLYLCLQMCVKWQTTLLKEGGYIDN
jgi:hypothetical protein